MADFAVRLLYTIGAQVCDGGGGQYGKETSSFIDEGSLRTTVVVETCLGMAFFRWSVADIGFQREAKDMTVLEKLSRPPDTLEATAVVRGASAKILTVKRYHHAAHWSRIPKY